MQKLQHNLKQILLHKVTNNNHLLVALSQRIGERPSMRSCSLLTLQCSFQYCHKLSHEKKRQGDKNEYTWSFQMSACLCTHSYDEIFNFTGVERTITEINEYLYDNTNDYIIRRTRWKKYQMIDKWRRLIPIIKGSFTASFKYKRYSIAKHDEEIIWYKSQRMGNTRWVKQIPYISRFYRIFTCSFSICS